MEINQGYTTMHGQPIIKKSSSESTLNRGLQEQTIRYFNAGNFQYTKCTSYKTFSRVYNIPIDNFIYTEVAASSQMQLGGDADIVTLFLRKQFNP